MTASDNILDKEIPGKEPHYRRKLLPWWMKVFCWLFMIIGVIASLGILVSLSGFTFELSLYGIETKQPLSLPGLSVIVLLILKGITSYLLWTEKDKAIILALADAVIGIMVCLVVMVWYAAFGYNSRTFRGELIFLIPYFIKLLLIKPKWDKESSLN